MRASGEAGITLIEITIVLTVLAVISAVAAPTASRTLDRARVTRALGDQAGIRTAILAFANELPGYQGFNIDGTSPSATPVNMLVSDGDTPREASATGDARWDDPVDNATGLVDFLERHLVTNNPRGNAAFAYPISGGNQWRGAYLTSPIDPDPWGNRYAVNTKYLQTPANTKMDTFVLSAGPDEQIDTAFEKDGITPGDDDLITVVRRDRNLSVP